MTIQVNIARAKATLSELVALAESGEEVVLARAGKPVVTLAPVKRMKARRTHKHPFLGALAHLGPLTEEEAGLFLQPDPEMERLALSEDEDDFYL